MWCGRKCVLTPTNSIILRIGEEEDSQEGYSNSYNFFPPNHNFKTIERAQKYQFLFLNSTQNSQTAKPPIQLCAHRVCISPHLIRNILQIWLSLLSSSGAFVNHHIMPSI